MKRPAIRLLGAIGMVCALVICLLDPAASAQTSDTDRFEAIERELEAMKRREAERERRIEELERELELEKARSAERESGESRGSGESTEPSESSDATESGESTDPTRSSAPSVPAESSVPPDPAETVPVDPGENSDIWSRNIRNTNIRLMDIGLDVLFAAGTSTVDNAQVEVLQSGAHDPRQIGFTLQQIELSMQGAVDPYLHAAAYLVFFIDPDGESQFEVEEAFALSQALPFGLDDAGFQIEAGTFFTEFGYQNPRHPHLWTWQDQPIVMSRLLGGDGLRGPGFRIGWMMPVPWFSELHFGMQNAVGETQVSFFANQEVYRERPIGGRPFVSNDVQGGEDLTYLVRWANGFDPSDSWSMQVGVSAAFGPNPTRDPSTRSYLYGLDAVAKWLPEAQHRGWPFVVLQAEVMGRSFDAAAFDGTIDIGGTPTPATLPGDSLHDWGLYTEGTWGFWRMWAAGLRYEFATGGGGPSYDGATPIASNLDPYRSTRHRVSPMLLFQPTEFTRLRIQYNYDHDTWLRGETGNASAHSFWFGFEFGLGSHPAHSY